MSNQFERVLVHYENKIKQLEKENAMSCEALEFYANKTTWQSVYVGYGDKSQIRGIDLEDLSSSDRPDEYGGKRAREVLAKINKEKEERNERKT